MITLPNHCSYVQVYLAVDSLPPAVLFSTSHCYISLMHAKCGAFLINRHQGVYGKIEKLLVDL